MRQHIRVDSIKVFDEENRLIEMIMKKEGITNKSDAWRAALKVYRDFHESNKELRLITAKIDELKSNVEQIYLNSNQGELR